MPIGNRFKEIRLRLGISQTEFAKMLGVSKQTLYKYENDIITNIPSNIVEKAAKLGHVSPSYLMGWDSNMEYYTDQDAAELAQELLENPDMRVLFDAAKDSTSKDLQMAADLLKRFKSTNPDG